MKLSELPARVGEDLGEMGWQTITLQDVQWFADATRAHEWIHLDVVRSAKESPFGATVAHGYLTLSLATLFVTELIRAEAGIVGINYGLNRVRFPAPVPVGSRVRARGSLRAAACEGEGIRTVIELVYEIEGSVCTPCVAEVVSLLLPASSLGLAS
jgi:acyl dehydratase